MEFLSQTFLRAKKKEKKKKKKRKKKCLLLVVPLGVWVSKREMLHVYIICEDDMFVIRACFAHVLSRFETTFLFSFITFIVNKGYYNAVSTECT